MTTNETTRALTVSEARERGAVTVEEAASLLSIGRSTAYALARTGELPTIRLGRRVVVPTAALLRMVGADAPEPTQPEPTRLQLAPTVLGGPVGNASSGRLPADNA